MDQVTDLSELCRLCLESSQILIPFETKVYYSTKSIPELVMFCLDVDCDDADGLLPKHICQSCLEKLQHSFEFKEKSRESDKYLRQIVNQAQEIEDEQPELTPYSPITMNPYEGDDDDDVDDPDYMSLLEPVDNPSTSTSINDLDMNYLNNRKGVRCGDFVCKICKRVFKYVKPFRNHMLQHGHQLPASNGRQAKSKPSIKQPLKVKPKPKPKSRPQRKAPSPVEQTISDSESAPESPKSSVASYDPTADFAEVNPATFLYDESFTQSFHSAQSEAVDERPAPRSKGRKRARSRSSSVELIPEVDIFTSGGSVLPDDDMTIAPPVKTGFYCEIKGCNQKFHLRANLNKHIREKHNRAV